MPHAAWGIVAAAVTALLARYFVLQPALGLVDGKDASMVLLFFLLGYLALPIAPIGQSPLPLASWIRLRTGLLFGLAVFLVIILPDRL